MITPDGRFSTDCVRRGEANLSFSGNSTLPLSAMYISVLTALSVLNVPVYVCVDIFVALCIDNIAPTVSVCFDISVPCTCLY